MRESTPCTLGRALPLRAAFWVTNLALYFSHTEPGARLGLLTHLLLLTPSRIGIKIGIVVTAFLSALLSEAAGWMTRFWSPGFACLKVTSFLVFQVTLARLIGALTWFLATAEARRGERHARRREATGGRHHRDASRKDPSVGGIG